MALASAVAAEQPEEITRFPAPKGDTVLVVRHHVTAPDHLRLESKDGKLLREITLETDVESHSVRWNPDGSMVAFSAGSRFLLAAQALIRTKDGWQELKLPDPGDRDNFHCVPLKWSGQRLIISVSGPYAGKRITQFYSGTMTVEIAATPPGAKKVAEKIRIKKEEEDGEFD